MSDREIFFETSRWETSFGLADSVVRDDIQYLDWYESLTTAQRKEFEAFIAPLLVQEGLETGRAISEELADDSVTKEECLSKEIQIYVNGMTDLSDLIGR